MVKTAKGEKQTVRIPRALVENMNRMGLTANEDIGSLLSRVQLMRSILDDKRDLDNECGYPQIITREMYRLMYDRHGVAKRVVNVYPESTWKVDPEIFEDDDESSDTPFEQAWKALNEKRHMMAYMHRMDRLSGIGHFGVALIGIDDGKDLAEPVDGIGDDGEPTGKSGSERQLTYVRCFDESMVYVSAWESDPLNPRYGQPTMYLIQFMDWRTVEMPMGVGIDNTMRHVHWHRIVHIADNRDSSEVFGIPRQKPVFNDLLDIRKVNGSSSEMFWRGGFPGLSFEVNPDLVDVEIDQEEMKDQMAKYSLGLQRYLALTGVSAKSLSPQVADPTGHLDSKLRIISLTIGVPWRIFIGSEEAKLAGQQDDDQWNDTITMRQSRYVSPYIIRPWVNRLIAMRVLPAPKRKEDGTFSVNWPDAKEPSAAEKATVANTQATAMGTYVSQGVAEVIPEREWLIHFMGIDEDQVDAILEAADKRQDELAQDMIDGADTMRGEMPGPTAPNPDDPNADNPGKPVQDPPGKKAVAGGVPVVEGKPKQPPKQKQNAKKRKK